MIDPDLIVSDEDLLQSYARKGLARMAAEYDPSEDNAQREQMAADWIRGQGMGNGLPGQEDFDYGAMLAAGIHPTPDADGHLPLPPRFFRPGRVHAHGVDIATGERVLSDASHIEGDIEAAVLALDDPETDPRVGRSLAAWLRQHGVDDARFEDGPAFTGERVDVADLSDDHGTVIQNLKHGTLGGLQQIGELLLSIDPDLKGLVENSIAARKAMLGPDPYETDPLSALLQDPLIIGAIANPKNLKKLLNVALSGPAGRKAQIGQVAAAGIAGVAATGSGDADAGMLDAMLKAGIKVALPAIKDAPSMNKFVLALKEGHPEAAGSLKKLHAGDALLQFDAGGVSGFSMNGAEFKHGVKGHLHEAIAWSSAEPSGYQVGLRKDDGQYGVIGNGVIAVFDANKRFVTFLPAKGKPMNDFFPKSETPR